MLKKNVRKWMDCVYFFFLLNLNFMRMKSKLFACFALIVV
jgi:hypothetical protein